MAYIQVITFFAIKSVLLKIKYISSLQIMIAML